MEEYQKDIDIIYKRLNESDQRITKLESTKDFFQDVLKKNVELSEKLSETLQDVKTSMINLNNKMEVQVEIINNVDKRISMVNEEASQRISLIDKRLQNYEDKSTFDILLFLKHNWGWIMVLLGMGILYASQFAKF